MNPQSASRNIQAEIEKLLNRHSIHPSPIVLNLDSIDQTSDAIDEVLSENLSLSFCCGKEGWKEAQFSECKELKRARNDAPEIPSTVYDLFQFLLGRVRSYVLFYYYILPPMHPNY